MGSPESTVFCIILYGMGYLTVQQLYTTLYLAAYSDRDIIMRCVTSCFEDCEDTIARGQLASYCSTGVILVPLIKRESTA